MEGLLGNCIVRRIPNVTINDVGVPTLAEKIRHEKRLWLDHDQDTGFPALTLTDAIYPTADVHGSCRVSSTEA